MIKFGWILLREGLIQRNQMENILNLKERHQDRLFGELASHYFDVPEDEIEDVFANHVLLPFFKNWFLDQVRKKVKIKDADMDEFITHVEVTLSGFTRKIIRSTAFAQKDKHLHCASKNVDLRISGTLAEIVIHTSINETLVFRDVQFEFKRAHEEIALLNPHIFTEAKTRLTQLYKKYSLSQA